MLTEVQLGWLRKSGIAPDYKDKGGTLGRYPAVESEEYTLGRVLAGCSLARFGDGEMKLVAGGSAVAQRETSDKMRAEFATILDKPSVCMVGILNVYSATPRLRSLIGCATETFTKFLPRTSYVSSLITRPDIAPWIDTPEYWEKFQSLWRGKEVTLVLGSMRSLIPDELRAEGCTVHEVWGPRTNAYAQVDQIEEQIGKPNHPVLLALGPTATALAWRLANKRLWAIDIGHVGMFLRHKGSFMYKLDDLASRDYRILLERKHQEAWNGKGHGHLSEIVEFYRRTGSISMLDYGCGHNATIRRDAAKLNPPIRVSCYDPGVPLYAGMPKPVDFVACTDVLEHIEPDKLHNVVDHIFNLTGKAAFLIISCGLSKHKFPDGRNVHLSVHPPQWWLDYLGKWGGWKVDKWDTGKHLRVWLSKK